MTISVLRRPRPTQEPVPTTKRTPQAATPRPTDQRLTAHWVRTTGADGRTRMEMRWDVAGSRDEHVTSAA